MKRLDERAFPGNGLQRLTPEGEEKLRLKHELVIVTEEKDILKKLRPSSQRNRNDLSVCPGAIVTNHQREPLDFPPAGLPHV
ncbi:MAG: hypothetical protein ACOX30_10290 [Dethiobacteria bacterium]